VTLVSLSLAVVPAFHQEETKINEKLKIHFQEEEQKEQGLNLETLLTKIRQLERVLGEGTPTE